MARTREANRDGPPSLEELAKRLDAICKNPPKVSHPGGDDAAVGQAKAAIEVLGTLIKRLKDEKTRTPEFAAELQPRVLELFNNHLPNVYPCRWEWLFPDKGIAPLPTFIAHIVDVELADCLPRSSNGHFQRFRDASRASLGEVWEVALKAFLILLTSVLDSGEMEGTQLTAFKSAVCRSLLPIVAPVMKNSTFNPQIKRLILALLQQLRSRHEANEKLLLDPDLIGVELLSGIVARAADYAETYRAVELAGLLAPGPEALKDRRSHFMKIFGKAGPEKLVKRIVDSILPCRGGKYLDKIPNILTWMAENRQNKAASFPLAHVRRDGREPQMAKKSDFAGQMLINAHSITWAESFGEPQDGFEDDEDLNDVFFDTIQSVQFAHIDSESVAIRLHVNALPLPNRGYHTGKRPRTVELGIATHDAKAVYGILKLRNLYITQQGQATDERTSGQLTVTQGQPSRQPLPEKVSQAGRVVEYAYDKDVDLPGRSVTVQQQAGSSGDSSSPGAREVSDPQTGNMSSSKKVSGPQVQDEEPAEEDSPLTPLPAQASIQDHDAGNEAGSRCGTVQQSAPHDESGRPEKASSRMRSGQSESDSSAARRPASPKATDSSREKQKVDEPAGADDDELPPPNTLPEPERKTKATSTYGRKRENIAIVHKKGKPPAGKPSKGTAGREQPDRSSGDERDETDYDEEPGALRTARSAVPASVKPEPKARADPPVVTRKSARTMAPPAQKPPQTPAQKEALEAKLAESRVDNGDDEDDNVNQFIPEQPNVAVTRSAPPKPSTVDTDMTLNNQAGGPEEMTKRNTFPPEGKAHAPTPESEQDCDGPDDMLMVGAVAEPPPLQDIPTADELAAPAVSPARSYQPKVNVVPPSAPAMPTFVEEPSSGRLRPANAKVVQQLIAESSSPYHGAKVTPVDTPLPEEAVKKQHMTPKHQSIVDVHPKERPAPLPTVPRPASSVIVAGRGRAQSTEQRVPLGGDSVAMQRFPAPPPRLKELRAEAWSTPPKEPARVQPRALFRDEADQVQAARLVPAQHKAPEGRKGLQSPFRSDPAEEMEVDEAPVQQKTQRYRLTGSNLRTHEHVKDQAPQNDRQGLAFFEENDSIEEADIESVPPKKRHQFTPHRGKRRVVEDDGDAEDDDDDDAAQMTELLMLVKKKKREDPAFNVAKMKRELMQEGAQSEDEDEDAMALDEVDEPRGDRLRREAIPGLFAPLSDHRPSAAAVSPRAAAPTLTRRTSPAFRAQSKPASTKPARSPPRTKARKLPPTTKKHASSRKEPAVFVAGGAQKNRVEVGKKPLGEGKKRKGRVSFAGTDPDATMVEAGGDGEEGGEKEVEAEYPEHEQRMFEDMVKLSRMLVENALDKKHAAKVRAFHARLGIINRVRAKVAPIHEQTKEIVAIAHRHQDETASLLSNAMETVGDMREAAADRVKKGQEATKRWREEKEKERGDWPEPEALLEVARKWQRTNGKGKGKQ